MLKSGTDFRQFSKVTLDFGEKPVSVEIEAVDVTKSYEPDLELESILEKYTGKYVQFSKHWHIQKFPGVVKGKMNKQSLAVY